MDVSEQINLFYKLIEQEYYKDLIRQVSKGEKFLKIDFNKLSEFNPELAELLLESPEEVIRAVELAVDSFDIEGNTKNFKTRFFNLPPSQRIQVRNIRANHIGKLLEMTGLVRQKSDVRPQVTSARFECPSCGNIITVLQLDTAFKEPSRCSCGRRGKFRLISKELVDAQKIVLEESPDDLEGGEQPKRLNIFLKSDLVSPMSDRRTNPGSKISVNGVIKEIPIESSGGVKSTRFDLFCDANNVEPLQEDFYELVINEEEEKKILQLGEDKKIFEKLVSSLAPSIYGHDKVKEAILLQMFGGVSKKRSKGDMTRGDIHILLVGDPGSGKSQLLKRVSEVAPKSRYVSGKGATGAGLTASVVKDEFLRGWALEAGALVLANKGICCIDELDKMTPEDQAAMHEGLEQQTITINKANIQATLRCETTVLAAANPKFGRFDPYEMLAKQIELPTTLLNRFDLIFPVRDLPDKEKDEKMASFILKLHQSDIGGPVEIDADMIKKYVSYSRRRIHPKLTDAALKEIKDFFVSIRNVGEKEAIRTIAISPRQLEALVRLSEASARSELRDKVLKRDAQKAIELLHYCLSQIGLDPETGKIDIDTLTTGISSSQRSNIVIVREVITELEKVLGKELPVEDILREAEIRGVDKDKIEEIIEKLKRTGDIFSPRHGIISKI